MNLGQSGEDAAAAHLAGFGLKIVERNVRCSMGEIDLVCSDGKTIVFVEVKTRSGASKGVPQESVSPAKQRRLTRLAQWYLKSRGLMNRSARFDVVGVLLDGDEPETTWIVNAFDARVW